MKYSILSEKAPYSRKQTFLCQNAQKNLKLKNKEEFLNYHFINNVISTFEIWSWNPPINSLVFRKS